MFMGFAFWLLGSLLDLQLFCEVIRGYFFLDGREGLIWSSYLCF